MEVYTPAVLSTRVTAGGAFGGRAVYGGSRKGRTPSVDELVVQYGLLQ